MGYTIFQEKENPYERRRRYTDISSFKPLKGFIEHPDSYQKPLIPFSDNLNTDLVYYEKIENYLNDFKFTKEYIEYCMIRYDQFMKLKMKHPDAYLVPTIDIEIIWISHLLRPEMYEKDCDRLYGGSVCHKLQCDQDELCIKFECLLATENLWKDEYSTNYFEVKPEEIKYYYEISEGHIEDVRDHGYFYKDKIDLQKTSDISNFDWTKFSITVEDILEDRQWFKKYKTFLTKYHGDDLFNTMEMIKSYERFL